MNIGVLFYKSLRKIFISISFLIDYAYTIILFKGNGVKYENIVTHGVPYVINSRGGSCYIGKNFTMNNGIKSNTIGSYRRCTFFIGKNAVLKLGNNVGISQTALICHQSITIGDNVKIGGGVSIYDTDFHSLDSVIRNSEDDKKMKKCAPVVIHDNAFIGAHSIILKGVTIGKNSIVGAGSLVTKSIPDNQIWGGNPAKLIRKI